MSHGTLLHTRSPAACVENIDSRMGLEPLDEGLRLHERLCVEEDFDFSCFYYWKQ